MHKIIEQNSNRICNAVLAMQNIENLVLFDFNRSNYVSLFDI